MHISLLWGLEGSKDTEPCVSGCIDAYGASVYLSPQTQHTTLPIVFLFPPLTLLPMTLLHYTYFSMVLQTLLMELACRGELYLHDLLGKCRTGNVMFSGLVKGNKTRAIKNNWNMNSHHSTSASSILVAHIGSPRTKGERALVPFLFPPCRLCKSSFSSCERRMYSP